MYSKTRLGLLLCPQNSGTETKEDVKRLSLIQNVVLLQTVRGIGNRSVDTMAAEDFASLHWKRFHAPPTGKFSHHQSKIATIKMTTGSKNSEWSLNEFQTLNPEGGSPDVLGWSWVLVCLVLIGL